MMDGGIRKFDIEKKSLLNHHLVTVITVVLNGEKHLEQTIQSVLSQTYDYVEYIIIDGQSTDKTIDIIKKYEDKIDYWISGKDDGIYDAMNKGIQLAHGELIGILNADDYYNENAVKLIVQAYEKTNADVFHGDMIVVNQNNLNRMKPDETKMNEKPSIFHPTCFIKKSVYQTIGSFDTKYKISADYDFLLRCIQHKYVLNYIPEPLTYFRPGGMSASCASNIEGYKIMKTHQTGFHQQVIWRTIKCYVKTFIKKILN